MDYCEKGEFEKARLIHERVLLLAGALLTKPQAYLHSRYKYVTYLTGAIPNPLVRLPQHPVSEVDQQRLREAAKNAGLTVK
jgi:dihydrodipicolinate synthase/N-acetylneuraminate lyase